jgi:hypothetical protein
MMSPMGFIESWKKGWSFMKAAFRMARENKRLLLPSLYQVLISIGYIVAWVAAIIAINPRWSDGTWAAVSAVATFGSFFIFYFFCGVTVNMVDVHLKGGTPKVADGVKDAGKNFVAIMFLAIVSTIINAITSAIRDEKSIIGSIVAGIIDSIWATLSFLLLPAIIIEDAGFGQAMKRVRELHKGNMLLIGIGEIGVRGLTSLIGFLWMLLGFGALYVGFATIGGTAGAIIGVSVFGIMLSLFIAFSTYVRMAYYTCLYLWAADVAAKGDQAPAPLPLAIALGHTSVGQRSAA